MSDRMPDLGDLLRRDGPDTAPPGLLGRVLQVSGRTRQRPPIVAVGMGAPMLVATRTGLGGSPRALAIAVLALAGILVGTMAMAGAFSIREDPLLLVLSTDGPTRRPVFVPDPAFSFEPRTPVPLPTAPRVPPPTAEPSVRPSVAGRYWVTGTMALQPWGVYGSGCVADFCAATVAVRVSPAVMGVTVVQTIAGAEVEETIAGRTLEDVGRSWTDAFPDQPLETYSIDGRPALVTPRQAVPVRAVTVEDGRVYLLTAFGITGSRLVLDGFVQDFHLFAPPCWLAPCEEGVDTGLGSAAYVRFEPEAADGSWSELPVFEDLTPDDSLREYEGRDLDRGFLGGVRISVGSTATGAAVLLDTGLGPTSARRIRGVSLDALEASWIQAFRSDAMRRVTVDGMEALEITRQDGVTLLAIHRGMVIAVTAWGFTRLDPDHAGTMRRVLAALTLQP